MKDMYVYSFFSGITVFLGGILANFFNHHLKKSPFREEVSHLMMSFGSGVILSALCLVLIPRSMELLSLGEMSFSFGSGALVFMFIDRYLQSKGGKTATLLAMLMDFVPESIALGAVFVLDENTATLLAIFIGLQNLPEAFNSFRDMVQSGFSASKTLVIFFGLSFFGVVAASLGFFILKDYQILTGYLMSFASGGILYLLIQDLIPESKLERTYFISLGASLGFLVGIVGEKVL